MYKASTRGEGEGEGWGRERDGGGIKWKGDGGGGGGGGEKRCGGFAWFSIAGSLSLTPSKS